MFFPSHFLLNCLFNLASQSPDGRAVGKSVGHLLDSWLMLEGPVHHEQVVLTLQRCLWCIIGLQSHTRVAMVTGVQLHSICSQYHKLHGIFCHSTNPHLVSKILHHNHSAVIPETIVALCILFLKGWTHAIVYLSKPTESAPTSQAW